MTLLDDNILQRYFYCVMRDGTTRGPFIKLTPRVIYMMRKEYPERNWHFEHYKDKGNDVTSLVSERKKHK